MGGIIEMFLIWPMYYFVGSSLLMLVLGLAFWLSLVLMSAEE